MEASISLYKGITKFKGNGKKVIDPIHPSQEKPWTEPINDNVDVQQLYQIQNNENYTETNSYGELQLQNPDSIGYNADAELYDWELENYELQAQECCTI